MAINLYQEAIAEARQLREMAEQSAKNKIVDAVTPQIRSLIEAQLLGEQPEVAFEDEVDVESLLPPEDVLIDPEEVEVTDAGVIDLDSMLAGPPPGVSVGGTTVNVDPDANVEIHVGQDTVAIGRPDEFEVVLNTTGEEDFSDEEELVLSTEGALALAKLLKRTKAASAEQITRRLVKLVREARQFGSELRRCNISSLSSSQRTAVRRFYRKMLREAVSLRKHAILSEVETNVQGLDKRADLLVREIRKMAGRRPRGLFDRLFEQNAGELDEVDALITLTPEDEDESEEVEALLGDLSVEFEIEEPVDVDVDVEDFEVEDEVDVDELELDLGEDDEPTDVVEIDESMLRRELRRMRALREQEEGRAAEADPALAHGGDDLGDIFVDVDEDDLLNALADELGDPGVATPVVGFTAVAEARRNRSPRRSRARRRGRVVERRSGRSRRPARNQRISESRQNRALNGKLHDYRKAVTSLRGQLSEMNLFNAKLLYVNKLMQNRNVTPKQQRVIVEALDSAKTLREAKLLYKSLTASLNKKGNLLESRARRSLGSASKSTPSAQPLTEGAGSVDRWAVLAGLPDKNSK